MLVWEGVTQYLSEEAVRWTLAFVGKSATGSILVLDLLPRKTPMCPLCPDQDFLAWIKRLHWLGFRRVFSWNEEAEQLYGWTEREALGRIADTFLKTHLPLSRSDLDTQLEQISTVLKAALSL